MPLAPTYTDYTGWCTRIDHTLARVESQVKGFRQTHGQDEPRARLEAARALAETVLTLLAQAAAAAALPPVGEEGKTP